MYERVRGSLAALPLALGFGCESEPSYGPELTVFQLDADQSCWRMCQGEAIQFAPVGERCESNTCSFESGHDRVLIVAEYDDLSFGRKTKPPDPEVEFIFDENVLSVDDTLRFDGAERQHATGTVRVPASSGARMRVRVGDGYEQLSDAWPSAAPSLDLRIEGCEQDCALPAGLGRTRVVLRDPPRVVGLTSASLIERIDGVLHRRQDDALALVPGEQVIDLDIPDRPGTKWNIRAQIGEFVSHELAVELVEPRPLELAVVEDDDLECSEINFAVPPPRALRGEPAPECREYTIMVHAPDRPQGPVEVRSNAGVLAGGGTAATVDLDGENCGRVRLTLPDSTAAPASLELAAQAEGLSTVTRTWSLEPTPVLGGELFVPAGDQLVDADGTKQVTISGNLTPVLGGSLDVGTRVAIVVTATPDDAVLECGAALPAENIACNTEGIGGGPKGGCQLSNSSILAQPDGSFAFELHAGVCFSGTVEIELFGSLSSAVAAGQCVLDVPIAAESSLDTAFVTFVAESPP